MGEKIEETIVARGHSEITATHSTTLMITRDEEIGPEADCVLAVAADKGGPNLSEAVRRAIASGGEVEVTIEAGGEREVIRGRGHAELSLADPKDLVVRKSDYTCGRTLIIGADKAAADLSRELVKYLKNPETRVRFVVRVVG